jgi:hypothetical protein
MLYSKIFSNLIYLLGFLSIELYELFELGNSANVISVQKLRHEA